jgi:hypothetical protein
MVTVQNEIYGTIVRYLLSNYKIYHLHCYEIEAYFLNKKHVSSARLG